MRRDPLIADFPYADDGPHQAASQGTYAAPAAILTATETVQWAHSLGKITTGVCRAGFGWDSSTSTYL